MNNYIIYIVYLNIYILILDLYKQNKIRFSNKKILSIISYNKFLYYLTLFIIILHTIFGNYIITLYPPFNNYIHYLLLIIAFLYINITYSKPIINNNNYMSPPKFLRKKKYIKYSYLLIIILLITTIIIEKKNIKNYINYFIPLFINLFLYIILYHLHNTFSTCNYNLPITFS